MTVMSPWDLDNPLNFQMRPAPEEATTVSVWVPSSWDASRVDRYVRTLLSGPAEIVRIVEEDTVSAEIRRLLT